MTPVASKAIEHNAPKHFSLPPNVERKMKQTAFISNMLAVAKEFNLYVFWRESDKKNPVLKMPWR